MAATQRTAELLPHTPHKQCLVPPPMGCNGATFRREFRRLSPQTSPGLHGHSCNWLTLSPVFHPISAFCLVRCSACALHHLLVLRSTHVRRFDQSSSMFAPTVRINDLERQSLFSHASAWSAARRTSTEVCLMSDSDATSYVTSVDCTCYQ